MSKSAALAAAFRAALLGVATGAILLTTALLTGLFPPDVFLGGSIGVALLLPTFTGLGYLSLRAA